MFEDSFVDAGKGLQAGRTRWMIAASLSVQAAVVAGFIAVPLMWPAVLPVVVAAPRVALVTLPKPRVKVETIPRVESKTPDTKTLRAPASHEAATVVTARGGGVIARSSLPASDAGDAPSLATGSGMGSIFAGGPGFGTVGSPGVRVAEAVAPRPAGPVKVSSGVSAGLLLEAIRPVYPTIARAARVEGTVVLTAIIGKDGRIRGLQVVSGPEMLRRAALDAVQVARYAPYRLNGAPTDVVTTVSVVFRMQG